MKRFVVVVLDSFGVGAMDDVKQVRPQDLNAHTVKHLIEYPMDKKWPTLVELGLMNALGESLGGWHKSKQANFGISKLKHDGADTFFGHQELMGTNPKAPIKTAFSKIIDAVDQDLKTQGYQVRYVTREGLSLLVVNESMCIGDNMETDLGQAINVTGCLDICSFETIRAVGHLVRQHVKVPRIIAFGGRGVRLEDLLHHIVIKDGHIGIDAPASGVYKKDYHVVHIGYGVDPKVQLPHVLAQKQIPTYLYGKVADIVEVELGSRYPCVDTNEAFDYLIRDLKQNQTGFYCLNVQETDLAGHAQNPCRYIDRINVSDQRIQETMSCLNKGDVLIVMADHGNDPTCGHSKHTREYVPILIYQSDCLGINIGVRESLADVGATVAEYFEAKLAYGASFYHLIN